MAEQAIATIPQADNNRNKFRIAGMPTFSTATMPGLLQAYAVADQVLPYLCPQPAKVMQALDDPARRDRAILFLQKGAKALNAIECLEDGSPEAMEQLRTLLYGLTHDLYKEAERA